jgi:hypothetical protein
MSSRPHQRLRAPHCKSFRLPASVLLCSRAPLRRAPNARMNTTGRTPYEEAYDAIQCDTLEHADSRFIHQHVVDAWAAQHATELTKPIALTFALVGLYLRVERGYTGRQVQRVHMDMARQKHEWPRFPLPQDRGAITAVDVAVTAPGLAREAAIDRWCAAVWDAYRDCRASVVELLTACGIGAVSASSSRHLE